MSSGPPDRRRECRPLPADRDDDYQRIVEYAFGPENGPGAVDDPGDAPGESDEADHESVDTDEPGDTDDEDGSDGLGTRYGAFVGDDLVSVCKHYDFTAHLRGEWVPFVGFASVATPPEHRREGHVRALVEFSLDRWRGEYPLAGLWPFDRGYYRQFGWETANKVVEYSVPPDQLAFAREAAAGSFRRVTADEWAELQDAHERHAADRMLPLRRDEDWWREKVFRVSDDDRPYVYAWEGDGAGDGHEDGAVDEPADGDGDGDVRGYVVFTFEKSGDGLSDRTLRVRDMAYADHEARLNLYRLIADHDSQIDEVVRYAEDASLHDLVPDPSELDCEVHAGPMVRVVDVERALSTVTYPPAASASLTLAVTDDTAPWNDGAFRLDVADGDGVCSRRDDPPADAESTQPSAAVDATVDVGTLSQLVVGYLSTAEARRVGDLAVSDETVAERLAALFPPETVALRTFF